jgi:hypothetical protein
MLNAELCEMTKKTFNWDKNTWTDDYKEIFENISNVLKKRG